MKKQHEEEHENSERWLLTYSDLITLLMIFFIIMYSMGKTDAKKFGAMAQSFQISMGGGKTLVGSDTKNNVSEIPVVEQERDLQEIKEKVDAELKKEGLTESVETKINERGLLIRLKDTILFDSGKADIKSVDQIIKIGLALSKTNDYIRIEGNTDNIPISNSEFKSNWTLSVIRATNVAELFIAKCNIKPDKIAAVGYGEFRPLIANDTDANRSKNRRVDIIIVNEKFNKLEANK